MSDISAPMAVDDEVNPEDVELAPIVETPKVQQPILTVANLSFRLTLPDELVPAKDKETIKQEILEHVKRDNMSAYYEHLCTVHKWTVDTELLSTMKAANEAHLAELTAAIDTAKENAGDIEVRDATLLKAHYYSSIGDKENATAAYEKTFALTVGVTSQIDVLFAELRLNFALFDLNKIESLLSQCQKLIELGGDWERKNSLSIYQAIYYIITRQFTAAAKLLTACIATFASYELIPYNTFIFYTCILALVSLTRPELKKDVLNNSEILQIIDEIPYCRLFIFSLYKCEYVNFFIALTHISTQIQCDRYLSPHIDYYLREIRLVAYTQYLDSYRTATLSSMGRAFGVSSQWMERELYRLIVNERLNARIDGVHGVVESVRLEEKHVQYAQLIKKGDKLCNRIQKLTKIVSY